MHIKFIILIILAIILISLGFTFYFAIHDEEPSQLSKALSWALLICALLLVFLLMGLAKGWLVGSTIYYDLWQ